MELVFQQCMSLYSTIQCLQPVHGQQDTFAEQKCIHPHNKAVFKTVHEYFKDFDEQHRLPYDKASLRPLVGHPYSFRNDTEKRVHVLDYKACFKPVNGPPKTFQDAMDPFTKQGNCPRTLIRKSPYTKAGPRSGSECPDLISRGNLFGAIPAAVPFIIQQSCVLICHWTTEDLFRITMQCFKSPGHNGIGFPTVHVSLLNNTMPPTCPWTAGYLR
ncbi:hypothetical protein TNCT_681971 [Trichonephila clavata]|uniref:Uncharacterized protein n=1 Tax=Trichonephila clavata TaxID=2740835 RepID=A0A8X6K903_TRICU|nr:hypothetical protein TNCT_681971 [Trichonephila clavata]